MITTTINLIGGPLHGNVREYHPSQVKPGFVLNFTTFVDGNEQNSVYIVQSGGDAVSLYSNNVHRPDFQHCGPRSVEGHV